MIGPLLPALILVALSVCAFSLFANELTLLGLELDQ